MFFSLCEYNLGKLSASVTKCVPFTEKKEKNIIQTALAKPSVSTSIFLFCSLVSLQTVSTHMKANE